MNKRLAIIISPNWRGYAQRYLAACLTGIVRQDFTGTVKIFLIDNESSAASALFLRQTVERQGGNLACTILTNARNEGFARANNLAMRLALQEGFDYLILFNLDGRAAVDCVKELVAAAEAEKNIGAVQARIMLSSDQERINSLGNVTHFLGFGYSDGYQEEFGKNKADPSLAPPFVRGENNKEICYPSGAAVLFKAEALKQVGLFDEEFWMYNEDQDLGWRLWLAGWRSVLAPRAVFYHHYEFSKSITKYYWMDRNRLLAIFKNYRAASLILIAPALLVMEIGLFFFAARGGWLKEKLKIYWYFLRPDTWRYLLQARRQTQGLRQVSDRKIVKLFSGKILYQEIDSPFLRLANIFFNLYWQIAKIFILW